MKTNSKKREDNGKALLVTLGKEYGPLSIINNCISQTGKFLECNLLLYKDYDCVLNVVSNLWGIPGDGELVTNTDS